MALNEKDDIIRPLISAVSSKKTVIPQMQSKTRWSCCFHLKHKCSISTGALMLLLWNMLMAASYTIAIYVPVGIILYNRTDTMPFSRALSISLGAYGFLGLIQMLYPIGGLFADVCCGRYRIIMLSLFNNLIACVFGTILTVNIYYYYNDKIKIVEVLAGLLAFVMLTVSFSGFQANAVQFGLDQLPDASSEDLSLFLHWFVWMKYMGETAVRILSAAVACSRIAQKIGVFTTVVFLTINTVYLILGYYKRHWFHREKTVTSPYSNVYKVLKYTAKHDKPLGYRSALTYSDDVKTPRIDFAKQKYGGPFTTEVVEDVKTFLRILLMLLAITPIFCLDIPTLYIFPIFGLHLGRNVTISTTSSCTYEWMLFQSGNLSSIISVVTIPLYIILIYPRIKKWVPRIMGRLGIGVVLMGMSVSFMFIIQVVASYNASQNMNNSTCLFLAEYQGSLYHISPTLEFPTQILVILNLLNGIAAPLINITVLEFISAQSPHTMKGLLLGVFYAFRGLFIAFGCVLAIPFTQEGLWGDKHGIFDCGFYYYLGNTLIAMFVLVVFLLVARWYRYRERDDPPYKRQYVEDYYSRYASPPTVRLLEEEDNSHMSYGTMVD